MNAAMIAGFGAVELNVKPNRADVWVDGRYVGEARDLLRRPPRPHPAREFARVFDPLATAAR